MLGRTFVYQNQTEIIPCGEAFVDFSERRSEVEATKEQPDWDSLAYKHMSTSGHHQSEAQHTS
jgi:hypothetical protein